MSTKNQKSNAKQSNFNGPGEYVGYLGGKIGGAVICSKGGKAGTVVGQEIGGQIGKNVGAGLDRVVDAQSQKIKKDYDYATKQGLNHQKASNFALDVNGWKDDW